MKRVSRKALVLESLPATAPELAAKCGTTVRRMAKTLCYLRGLGVVRRSEEDGERQGRRGRLPRYWITT